MENRPNLGSQRERNAHAVRWAGVPRFHFHLLNDVDAPDPDGMELADLDAAREHAHKFARVTIAETIKDEGRVNLDHRIDIENEHGEVFETVRFRDVLRVEIRRNALAGRHPFFSVSCDAELDAVMSVVAVPPVHPPTIDASQVAGRSSEFHRRIAALN